MRFFSSYAPLFRLRRSLLFVLMLAALTFAALLLWRSPAFSQDLRGDWLGKFWSLDVRISLSLDTNGRGYSGSWTSPNQGGMPTAIRSCTTRGDSVFIDFAGLDASFAGTFIHGNIENGDTEHGDTEEIRGEWTQSGHSVELTLRRADKYEGVLDAGVKKLHLVFKIATSPQGLLATTLSPDQSPNEYPATEATDSAGHVHLYFSVMHASYDGIVSKDHQHIEGTFTQGRPFPMTLERSTTMIRLRRPQEPHPPFPYHTQDIRFRNAEEDVTLAGTLSYPNGEGPFPVVVLISGSGHNDRDENISEHKPLLVIADYLARHGVASLRYDKRGVNQSTGSELTATTSNYASDANAAVNYLRTRKEFDPKKIGLIGHSEGGIIAPMVAVRNPNVHFIVLLAAPGVRGDLVSKSQRAALVRAEGYTDSTMSDSSGFMDALDHIVVEAPSTSAVDSLVSRFVSHYEDSVLNTDSTVRLHVADVYKFFRGIVRRVELPWMVEFVRYDPAPTLKKVRCPTLALNGALDAQVLPDLNIPAIEAALKAGGNRDVTTRIFPGLNHLFQHAQTGAFSEYAKIEETFAPEVLDYLLDWIRKRTQ